jgi:hypothetical protein
MDLGFRPPPNLSEAARLHYTVKLTCKVCGHFHVFDPHALWWLFERRYWDNRIREIGRRFYCARCLTKGKKVKLPKAELVKEEPTGPQPPMPDEDVWRRHLKRQRT